MRHRKVLKNPHYAYEIRLNFPIKPNFQYFAVHDFKVIIYLFYNKTFSCPGWRFYYVCVASSSVKNCHGMILEIFFTYFGWCQILLELLFSSLAIFFRPSCTTQLIIIHQSIIVKIIFLFFWGFPALTCSILLMNDLARFVCVSFLTVL